jgi:hypothetical protein
MDPIRGIRYKCIQCVEYDLCENCDKKNGAHKNHLFLRISVPGSEKNLTSPPPTVRKPAKQKKRPSLILELTISFND